MLLRRFLHEHGKLLQHKAQSSVLQVALRQVEIPSGMFQVRMAHQKLDRPQVSS